jgi:hypothetical protein
MKKFSIYFMTFMFAALSFNSCLPIEDMFDESLLIGKWVMGTDHYRYDADGTGVSWDTADDYTEEEGLPFTWTLESAELTHIHIMETGGSGVPKIYTVTELTETSLNIRTTLEKHIPLSK